MNLLTVKNKPKNPILMMQDFAYDFQSLEANAFDTQQSKDLSHKKASA